VFLQAKYKLFIIIFNIKILFKKDPFPTLLYLISPELIYLVYGTILVLLLFLC